MRCPFCGNVDTQVKDSRPAEDNVSIRRRRSCPACAGRFTTYERVQLRDLVILILSISILTPINLLFIPANLIFFNFSFPKKTISEFRFTYFSNPHSNGLSLLSKSFP